MSGEPTDPARAAIPDSGADIGSALWLYPEQVTQLELLGDAELVAVIRALVAWLKEGEYNPPAERPARLVFMDWTKKHAERVAEHRKRLAQTSAAARKRWAKKSEKMRTHSGRNADAMLTITVTEPNQTKTVGGVNAAPQPPSAADFAAGELGTDAGADALIDCTAADFGDRHPNRRAWRDFIAANGAAEFRRLAADAKARARSNPAALLTRMIGDWSTEAARAEREAEAATAAKRKRCADAKWRGSDGEICRERCANARSDRCAAGRELPSAANAERPHPPEECPAYRPIQQKAHGKGAA